MKRLITAIALKLVPQDGFFRNLAKSIYARLYKDKSIDIIHRIMTEEEEQMLKDAVRIGFVGDLILLRDMVELGCNKADGYDYAPMFSSMRSYFSDCDLMTGVLEGPLSGDELGYTTANYEDGRPLKCGYPDSFLKAIKSAGINFVTVANNHLLDKGRKGMERTIAQLETNSMQYVGYGKKARTVLEVGGLKLAILAFNFAFNGHKESVFFETGNEDLPHPILPDKSKFYNKCLEKVKNDFDWAKSQNPHCIIVYPHMGGQFLHKPDKNQELWFNIFDSLGADVIFGCHSHATQPVRFNNDRFRLYCPGNFVNNYFPYDGDASAMVEVYLNKNNGKPFAAAIIPILAYGKRDEILRAEPMYRLAQSADLSWHDWLRLNEAHKVVTFSMLGTAIPIEQAQDRYFIWKDNVYSRLPYENGKCSISSAGRIGKKLFEEANTIAFIGDSITEGTKNGGYGWYEPMMASIPEKTVIRLAKGLSTSKTFLEQFGTQIKDTRADLFCIAIGCNDIRYREEPICAMTAEAYKTNMEYFISSIRENNPDSPVILIAPWHSDDVYDKHCKVDCNTKHRLYRSYTNALYKVAEKYGCVFVNPNQAIWQKIRQSYQSKYLVDWIHPNASDGIRLFSESFIEELSKLS